MISGWSSETNGENWMPTIFDNERVYLDCDPELDVLGSKPKRAQWRHRMVGPPWVKIGRKVAYLGGDLNAWLAAQRTDPSCTSNNSGK